MTATPEPALRPTERAVIDAAIAWWKAHRPVGWGLTRHLDSPCTNAGYTRGSKRLARAVAAEIRARKERQA